MEYTAATTSLLKRLQVTDALDHDDLEAVRALPISQTRIDGNQPIVTAGDRPSKCCLLIDGFIIRAKSTSDGSRQILAIHQSGDIPDLQSLFLHVMDHDVIAAGECLIGFIPHPALTELVRKRPNIAAALWRDTLTDAAIFREWILNVGQRSGAGSLAHLFLELYTRLKLIGRTRGNSFKLPLTQIQLGEATGMSAVHVNRILQTFRKDGLADFEHGTVHLLDEDRLMELGGFDPLYLHLDPAL